MSKLKKIEKLLNLINEISYSEIEKYLSKIPITDTSKLFLSKKYTAVQDVNKLKKGQWDNFSDNDKRWFDVFKNLNDFVIGRHDKYTYLVLKK